MTLRNNQMQGEGRGGRQFLPMSWSSYHQNEGVYDVEKKKTFYLKSKHGIWVRSKLFSAGTTHEPINQTLRFPHTFLSHWWVTFSKKKKSLRRVPSESLGRFLHLRRPFLSCLHGLTGHVSTHSQVCLLSTQKPPWSSCISFPELWKLDQVCIYWKLRLLHPKSVEENLVPNQYHFLKMVSLPSTPRSSSCLLSFKKSYSW